MDTGHFVDFYSSDAELVAAAADFLRQGFASGASCIAAFTLNHQAMLRKSMTAIGLDEVQLVKDYRLVVLDAEKSLDTLLTGDRIDVREFYRVVGDLIRLLAAGGRDVRVVGEMVGVLASRGRMDACMQLEELCNDLSREHTFRMYCLYCENTFEKPLDQRMRRRICATHSGSLRVS